MSTLILIFSLTFTAALKAQTGSGEDSLQNKLPTPDQWAQDPLDLEIGEMIFDETITKVGRDFYDEFFTRWTNPTQLSDFSISIKEKPMPGIGTQITLMIDDQEILQQFIRPNHEMIEMLADYCVGLVNQYLLNYQDIQSQLQNPDQSGTGIF